ncbi:MAG: hypothetical protein JRG94_04955 [Deltaproteobacteria bacterium]|nr:hypothetical protein [Deltaproteobacteria bacterium]MBW2723437.1 hypothetical protein [Deltaproteobacteria bacterium]
MAKHDVSFEIPQRPLGKADVEFRVRADGKMMGTLTVSNGSIVWFPRGTSYGWKMGWKRFNQVMKESAIKYEKR